MPISEILDGVWAENTAVMNHSNATTNIHGAGSNSLEQTGKKNIANGYAGLDANVRLSKSVLPTQILNSYWHASYDETNVVQGTWGFYVAPSQTDYDPSLVGNLFNATRANSDEIDFGVVQLNAGKYIVKVSYIKKNNGGILEILIGSTSIGTQDTYAAVTAYNNTVSFVISASSNMAGIVRLRSNGKNDSSSGYYTIVSRIEIIRVPSEEPSSVIPILVSVSNFIPYIDDALTYSNLIFCASGYGIAFDDVEESFNMVRI